MDRPFFQSPKAQKEILKAWEWYEEQQIGLGDRFKGKLREKIQAIQNDPLHYPLKGQYREALIEKFPFIIVFRFDEKNDVIIILSVFHTSRHPKRKHK